MHIFHDTVQKLQDIKFRIPTITESELDTDIQLFIRRLQACTGRLERIAITVVKRKANSKWYWLYRRL